MDKLLEQVVDRLTEKTKVGKVKWEDISSLSGGPAFRTRFEDAVVQVTDGEIVSRAVDDDEDRMDYIPYKSVRVLNERGYTVAHAQAVEGQPDWFKLNSLADAASAEARKRTGVLEKLLVELGK